MSEMPCGHWVKLPLEVVLHFCAVHHKSDQAVLSSCSSVFILLMRLMVLIDFWFSFGVSQFKFLKKLYAQKGNDWNKAATAYHSSVPKKAQKYAMKLSKVYKGIMQAHLETKAVNKTVAKAKRLEKEKLLAKNRTEIEAKIAQSANAWREARLAEYRLRKAGQL